MRSPSSRDADPQKRSHVPCGPPKARTRMSRAVAARRVTAARSPVTDNLSTNILRPSTGSGGWNSISSELQPPSSWPSARAAWGTVATAAAIATAATTARNPFGFFRRLSLRLSAPFPFPLMLSLSASVLLGLPNQRWGRKGIRPPFRSRPLRLGRRPRRVFPARLAISRSGPGPLLTGLTGWTGAGGSLRTSWDGGPA